MLKDQIREQLKQLHKGQRKSFERHVMPVLQRGDTSMLSVAYQKYQETVQPVHHVALKRVLDTLFYETRLEDAETFEAFQKGFLSLPRYQNVCNNQDAKTLCMTDDDYLEYEQTKEELYHEVITLFNNLNRFADSMGWVRPYPHTDDAFTSESEVCLSIIQQHPAIIGYVNAFMGDDRRIPLSEIENLMTLREEDLYKEAKSHQNTVLKAGKARITI